MDEPLFPVNKALALLGHGHAGGHQEEDLFIALFPDGGVDGVIYSAERLHEDGLEDFRIQTRHRPHLRPAGHLSHLGRLVVPQLVTAVDLLQGVIVVLGAGHQVYEGLRAGAHTALGHHNQDSALVQGQLGIVKRLLALVQIDVHGVGSHRHHDIVLVLDLHHEDLVGLVDGGVKRSGDIAGGGSVDVLVPVQYRHDGEDFLVLDQVDGILHVFVHGVALQSQRLGIGLQGQLVVHLDGLVGRHPGQERLASPGVPGEVVGLHRTDDDDLVSVHGPLVYLHHRPVLGGAQVDHLVVLGVVGEDAVLELGIDVPEDLQVLLLGGGPVCSSGHQEADVLVLDLIVDQAQNLGGGCGPGGIVDQEEHVFRVGQELVEGLRVHRVVQGGFQHLELIVLLHLVGIDDLPEVSLINVDNYKITAIRYGYLHDVLSSPSPELSLPVRKYFSVSLRLSRIPRAWQWSC